MTHSSVVAIAILFRLHWIYETKKKNVACDGIKCFVWERCIYRWSRGCCDRNVPLHSHFVYCFFCHGAIGFCFDWCKAMRAFCVNKLHSKRFFVLFWEKCWMKMPFEWEKQEMRFDIHPSLCLADNGIYLYLYLALRCHPLSAHLSHGSQFAFNLFFNAIRTTTTTTTTTSDEIHSMSTLRCVHLSGAHNGTQSHFHF